MGNTAFSADTRPLNSRTAVICGRRLIRSTRTLHPGLAAPQAAGNQGKGRGRPPFLGAAATGKSVHQASLILTCFLNAAQQMGKIMEMGAPKTGRENLACIRQRAREGRGRYWKMRGQGSETRLAAAASEQGGTGGDAWVQKREVVLGLARGKGQRKQGPSAREGQHPHSHGCSILSHDHKGTTETSHSSYLRR